MVRALAARQDGVVTTSQLVAAGAHRSWVSDRVLSGRWQRLHRGVLVVHSGPIPWRSRARAALLYAGRGAALSHRAAARIWDFTRAEPRLIDVSVPADRRVTASPGLVVHRRRTSPRAVGRLRMTVREETVVDLVAGSRTADDAVGWVGRGILAGAHPLLVREAAEHRQRFRHRGLLLDLLADGDLGSESALEHRYHRDVEGRHGLPRGRQQVRQKVGGLWTRADCLYEGVGLRVELDGAFAHPGGRTDRDVWRDNAAFVERGEMTLRYRWVHVAVTPCRTAAQVVAALRTLGWTGTPRLCGPGCEVR